MTLIPITRAWLGVWSPIETQNFFESLITDFYPLLHIVANVISKLEINEDMFSPRKGGCDSDQVFWVVL